MAVEIKRDQFLSLERVRMYEYEHTQVRDLRNHPIHYSYSIY